MHQWSQKKRLNSFFQHLKIHSFTNWSRASLTHNISESEISCASGTERTWCVLLCLIHCLRRFTNLSTEAVTPSSWWIELYSFLQSMIQYRYGCSSATIKLWTNLRSLALISRIHSSGIGISCFFSQTPVPSASWIRHATICSLTISTE